MRGQDDQGFSSKFGNPYGAFVSTDNRGWSSIDAAVVLSVPRPALVDGHNHPVSFHYQAATRTLTTRLNVNGQEYVYQKAIKFDDDKPLYYFTIQLQQVHSQRSTLLLWISCTTAVIRYLDDDAQNEQIEVLVEDQVVGNAGEPIAYATVAKIKTYQEHAYQLVHDGFTAASAAQKVYDTTDQVFEVCLKHQLIKKQETKQVRRTINYQFAQTGQFAQLIVPKISGYPASQQAIPAENGITGDFANQNKVITYQEEPVVVAPVVIHYQDEKGKTLVSDQTLTGTVGTAYQSQAKTIPGHALVTQPQNATGQFGKKNLMSLIFIGKIQLRGLQTILVKSSPPHQII